MAAMFFTTDEIDRIKTIAQYVVRGYYQRRILDGRQRVSGVDLKGTARRWSCGYSRPRDAVVRRFAAYLDWEFDGAIEVFTRKERGGRKNILALRYTENETMSQALANVLR